MTAEIGRRRAPFWLAVLWLGVYGATAGAVSEPTPTVDVRLRTGVAAGSTVTVQATAGVKLIDRTPGARPAAAKQGPASVGETFAEEIAIELPGYVVARPTVVDAHDALVSVVRIEPAGDHTTVAIAVRQPVSYTISRPSAFGEFSVEIKPRTTRVTKDGQRRQSPDVTRPRDPDEVAVDAQSLSFDQNSNVLVATGSVTITRGAMVLQADEVHYDRTNGTADARGNVKITDPEGTVEGDSAHISIDDETGWVDEARTRMEPAGYSVACERLDKRGGPLYGVTDGTFTTCNCSPLERTAWSIKGHKTDIRLDGMAVLKNASFRVLDVPVLWFPIFAFPANTDRESGLLFPRLSYSKRRGFQYEQPFYWAIDKSQDATVAIDVETEARLGVIGEYRYALSKTASGQFTAAYFNESIRKNKKLYEPTNPVGAPVDVGEDRFAIAGRHRAALGPGSKFYLDMLAVSDDAFFREINTFGFTAEQETSPRSQRYTTSKMGILNTWDEGYLQAQVKYNQDLINPQDLTPQQLPRVEGSQSMPLLADRVVARLAGNFTDFQRVDGFDGLRLHVVPDLFVPLPFGRYLSGSLTGRVRETGYWLTDNAQVALIDPLPNCIFLLPRDRKPGKTCTVDNVSVARHFSQLDGLSPLNSLRSQFSGEVTGRLGTELSRVYSLANGKLRHSIEPEVQYLWVPDVNRPVHDRVIPCRRNAKGRPLPGQVPGENCDATVFTEGYLFDRDDAINQRNFVSWGLTTRLLWRDLTGPEMTADDSDDATDTATPPVRELFRATLTHGYDFSRRLVGRSHASDVDIGARISPVSWLSARYDATVSFETRSIRGQTVTLALREPNYKGPGSHTVQLPSQIEVRYGYIADGVNKLSDQNPSVQNLLAQAGSHSAGINAYLRLGNYAGIFGTAAYDFNPVIGAEQGPHFVDWSLFLRLISRCDCWSVDFGVHERTNEKPLDDRQFRVQFTLVGLGSFGRGAAANWIGFGPNGPSRSLGGGFQ